MIFLLFNWDSTMPLAPTNLRVNDLPNPVGTSDAPHFGWYDHHAEADQAQTQYQLLVASSAERPAAEQGDVWDSGVVASGAQNHLAYGGRPLSSDTKYTWKVPVWDKAAISGPYSAPAAFVGGRSTWGHK